MSPHRCTGLLSIAIVLAARTATAQPADPPVDPPPPDAPPAAPPESSPDPAPPRAPDEAAPPPARDGRDARRATFPTVPPPKPAAPEEAPHEGEFRFGSYGRVVVASDARGGFGRESDIVAHGSRLDEESYVELELRREDTWSDDIETSVVSTLAIGTPLFHVTGEFDAAIAIRNLYLETRNLAVKGTTLWVGSRMLRGDDIYLLDYWPLDNLNTLGAGLGYRHDVGFSAMVHGGLVQPDTPFFAQTVERPAPLERFGAASVKILDRTKFIGSLRLAHDQKLGDSAAKPALKLVAYGEVHALPEGEREQRPRVYETLPGDSGFVIGGEVGGGARDPNAFVNLFIRYASGLAAYGQFGTPFELADDKTASGASELTIGASASADFGIVGLMAGATFRSFRDASERLDYDDVDEGIVVFRPSLAFLPWAGFALEGSYQAAQRGVIGLRADGSSPDPEGPKLASLFRIGVMPYVSPAGRGNFTRPHIRFIYAASFRDEEAKLLYPIDHPFRRRDVEHFIGLSGEWWFDSPSAPKSEIADEDDHATP